MHVPSATPIGSSPHTRGAQVLGDDLGMDLGIIPAYAGSTRVGRRPCRRSGDHPRIRGEHSTVPTSAIKHEGSSPHTRGARQAILPVSSLARIIPAYAGSTKSLDIRRNSSQDHPRIRGEHPSPCVGPLGVAGSSPHTRGARRAGEPGAFDSRIIPAYAGSTKSTPCFFRRLSGSSPHTRGAPRSRRPGCQRSRIIPAYAGST